MLQNRRTLLIVSLLAAALCVSPLSAAKRIAVLRLDRASGVPDRIPALVFASLFLNFSYSERFDPIDPAEQDSLSAADSSVPRFPGKPAEVTEVAKKLTADYALSGKVTLENGIYEVALQLVEASSGRVLNRHTLLVSQADSSSAQVQAIENACRNMSARLMWEQPEDYPITFVRADRGGRTLHAPESDIRNAIRAVGLPRGVEVDRVRVEASSKRDISVFGCIGLSTGLGALFLPFWKDEATVSIHVHVKHLEAEGVVEEEFTEKATSQTHEHLFISRPVSAAGVLKAAIEGMDKIARSVRNRPDLMQPRDTGSLLK